LSAEHSRLLIDKYSDSNQKFFSNYYKGKDLSLLGWM